MSIRSDTLRAKLTRFLERYTPNRDWSEQVMEDELAALLRAVERSAPQSGYETWWDRFEDALAESLRTRSWPSVGDVTKAAASMPKLKNLTVEAGDWRAEAEKAKLKAWLAGAMPIGAHLVTREALNEIGVFGSEAERAIAFAANPGNHGLVEGKRKAG